nr:DUF971 domain-containing protein [Rhodobium orientis]
MRNRGRQTIVTTEDHPWPTEIRLSKDRRTLTVGFDSGETFALPAEFLRIASPSAEVQGHSPDQRKTVPGKRNVEILSLEQVGNYAVKITFDDLHDTGLYTYDYLWDVGHRQDALWQRYLGELEAQGLSREP